MREIAEVVTVIEQIRQRFISHQGINWGICFKEENRLIGNLGFYFMERSSYKTDLGYTIARPYWRRGIATEAVRTLIRFWLRSAELTSYQRGHADG